MKESELQTEILKYLKKNKAWYVKTISSNRKGIPDIICCIQGYLVAIEVKAPNKSCLKYTTKLQKLELKAINDSGGYAFSTNSLQHFKNCINAFIALRMINQYLEN